MVENQQFYAPQKRDKALSLINEYQLTLMAGGTDILVQNRNLSGLPIKTKNPILYIGNIEDLNYISETEQDICIGACVTYDQLLHSQIVPQHLKQAIGSIGSPAIRNKGTMVGNICNASPSGDTLPLLYLYEARVKLMSIDGERILNIDTFISGVRKTCLKKNELVTEVLIPKTMVNTMHCQFEKVGSRKADAISKVSFAGGVSVENGHIHKVGFTFGAVGPTVIRNKQVEQQLLGKRLPLTELDMQKLITDYGEIINPIDDQRSTKGYRKTVALSLLREFLNEGMKID